MVLDLLYSQERFILQRYRVDTPKDIRRTLIGCTTEPKKTQPADLQDFISNAREAFETYRDI